MSTERVELYEGIEKSPSGIRSNHVYCFGCLMVNMRRYTNVRYSGFTRITTNAVKCERCGLTTGDNPKQSILPYTNQSPY